MSQEGARPNQSQAFLLGAIAAGILLLAVYLTSAIIENENGGISASVRTIGTCLAIWAFVSPKAGLYIISIEAFTLDFIKKVAVYYGTVSTGTIIDVLVVAMLAVLGTLAGSMLQAVALRRYKLSPLLWAVLGAAFLGTLGVLLAQYKTIGFEKSAENAFNGCVYIAIAIPMSLLLTDRKELCKLLNVQFFLAAIWAVWGIKQYLFGFTALEWFYAETGLSAVATEHMFLTPDPRPFGFGSGMPNFSVVSGYFCYGAWYTWHNRKHRLLFLACTIILLLGTLASLQRTILLLPLLVIAFYFMLQSLRRSIVGYAVCTGIFLLAVANAEYLLAHLSDINAAISVGGYWGQSMLNVSTYTERLQSWLNLKDPTTYSLFGLPQLLGSYHDVITETLMYYGVVGTGLAISIATYGAWFIQRMVLRVEDPVDRKYAIFWLAITVPSIATGVIGGGNFTANPVNVQIWTFFGACICMASNSRLLPVQHKKIAHESTEGLQVANSRVPMAALGHMAPPSYVPMAARGQVAHAKA